jgi:drug/metabolite transporter (DMT)-like permease
MKQPQVKITVLREYSESDIKNMGANILLRKKAKYWLTLFGLGIVWFIGSGLFFHGSTSGAKQTIVIIQFLPFLLIFFSFVYAANKLGKRLWDKIKDLPQPIKFDY